MNDMNDEAPIDPEKVKSSFQTLGTDHITIWGSNEEDTIEFYRDTLGMPLVLRQPNLDDPSQTHLFFDTGDGRILTFFVQGDRNSNPHPQKSQTGAVHHISFKINPERFEEITESLEDKGHRYNVFNRGIFHSIYTTDNNGLVIELSADKYNIPEERRGEIYAQTQKIREKDNSDYAKEKHLEAALEELGIDIDPIELPDADPGVGNI